MMGIEETDVIRHRNRNKRSNSKRPSRRCVDNVRSTTQRQLKQTVPEVTTNYCHFDFWKRQMIAYVDSGVCQKDQAHKQTGDVEPRR